MNIMFVKGNQLITAETGDTVLRGITRDSVLTLAREWGMEVIEKKISVDEIVESLQKGEINEAFGTGTAATIATIDTIGSEVEDYTISLPGPESFSTKVLKELDAIKTGKKEDTHQWIYKI